MLGLDWMREMGLSGFLDILFVWFVVYLLLVWSKKTRAASVLKGILIVAGVYLLTRQLNMVLAAELLEKFFAIILIALVVIFQEELRHLFEQIAVWSLKRRVWKHEVRILSREEVDILVRTLKDLGRDKIGALVVVRGKDLIIRHLDGGIESGSRISEAILKSIFDSSSIGHDGAIYIEGNQIVRFSCHLPLSKNLGKVGKGGTRHAAALGLSELCDALCLVVSEERGTISVARHGDLFPVQDGEQLREMIDKFYDEIYPKMKTKPWEGILKKNTREKLLGLLLAGIIWFVLVYGGKQTYKTFTVPVSYPPIKADLVMAEVKPDKVYVTLGGPRNAFFFLSPNSIKFEVQPEAQMGIQKVRIYPSDFEFPKELSMEVLAPQEIEFRITQLTVPAKKPAEIIREELIGTVKNMLPSAKAKFSNAASVNATGEEAATAAPQNGPQAKQPAKVPYLENAKPAEVVKYLENKLEGNAVIEPLNPKSPDNNKQPEKV